MSAELPEANNLQQQITGTRFYKKKEAQKREKKNRERGGGIQNSEIITMR